MARGQELSTLVAVLLFLTEFASVVKSCHPYSKELHICLNIYLERDFPLIETIIKGQQMPGYGGGRRVLLEGPDLENICKKIGELQGCYDGLLRECDTYWQLGRYLTLMSAFNSSYLYLCGNTTNNIRDLLRNGECVNRVGSNLNECSDSGIHWFTTWKQILRLQVEAKDLCLSIKHYKNCLVQNLQGVTCGKQAAGIYGGFLDTWIDSWCTGTGVVVTSGVTGVDCSISCKFLLFCIIMYILMSLSKHSL